LRHFVLLISHNSLSSDYVVDKEIGILRERQKNREYVHFYPLLLTPTPDIALEVVNDKNRRPRDGKSFFDYPLNERYRQMSDAVNDIMKIVGEIATRKSVPPPSPPSAPTSSAPEPVASSTLPPDPKMIGRKDRLEELVKAILDEDRPVVVPGTLGMGKTTLALAAAYHPQVIARFGKDRRFFVNLEPVPDADGLLRRLATDLGLAALGADSELEAKITTACASAPTLAILDNLETPWRKDAAATEALLGRLAAVEGLRLILTIRGEPPNVPGPGAHTLQDVERLGEPEARALFLRRAGKQFETDQALPGLLHALDGHPLSIELLAANAAGKSNLKGLAADWNDRRADMLKRGAADNRETSLRVSLDLSLAALNPPAAAHRLIRLMALLPDGLSEADSRTVLSDGDPTREERGAAAKLEDARLATRPDSRWRLLAPIRETLFAEFPPEADDRARLIELFLKRAALGEKLGTGGWREVRDELVAEAGNLDAMIGASLWETKLPEGLSSAVWGLAKLHRMTGLASMASLPRAAKRFHDAGDGFSEANCLMSLGDIAFYRSDYQTARQHYEAAVPLYRQVRGLLGEANCITRLGEIARHRSDHEEARQCFEAALPLFRLVGAVLGEANCIACLGDLAFARTDHEEARQRYEAALPLFRQVGAVLGEANCVGSLGDIALARSNHEEARERYEAALPLFQKVGAVLGEANCIRSLGVIALARSNHEEARERYEAALKLYQKVGVVLGEAHCIQGVGDIAERQGEVSVARERWHSALALYAKIPEPYSIGFSHNRLARCAATPQEAAEHREAARKAWDSIGRQDLID
jgi:tetratricopeptide (TPR) repeat protein